MTDRDLIDKAQSFMGKGLEALTALDKLLVGRALWIGRRDNPCDPDFGAWRVAQGFGALDRKIMQDWMWLAENEHYNWYLEFRGGKGIRAARQAWVAENAAKQNLSRYTRVAEILKDAPEEGMSLKDIEEIAPELANNARARLTEMVGKGTVVRPSRGHYRLSNEQEQAEVAARNAEEQAETEQTEKSAPGWFKHSQGIQTILRKAKQWVEATGHTAPYPRSAAKTVLHGQPQEAFFPKGDTWKDAITETCDVTMTKTYEDRSTKDHRIVGWAPGYRVRIVMDPVLVPVNDLGESIEDHFRSRKESDRC